MEVNDGQHGRCLIEQSMEGKLGKTWLNGKGGHQTEHKHRQDSSNKNTVGGLKYKGFFYGMKKKD